MIDEQTLQTLAAKHADQYGVPQEKVARLYNRLNRNQQAPVLIGYAVSLINQGVDVDVLTKAAAYFEVATWGAQKLREPL